MKHKFTYIIAPVVFCWCLFYLQGCQEPGIEDKNLFTKDDNLNLAKDTLHVKVLSEFQQPLISNSVSLGVLGSMNDPNFGNTYASFYAQCQLTSNNIFFGDNPGLDSAVLTLGYSGLYGNFDKPVNLSVYELNQNMVDSVSYHTNDAFQVNLPPIGQKNGFLPDFTDSIFVLNQGFAPHLRIPLSNSFGNKILFADAATLSNNSAFLNLFKGFYLTTNSTISGNGLLYLDLRSSLSKITLYYHNSTSDSLFYDLPLSGVTVNHFDNIYSNAPVYTSVNSPNPNGEQKMYIQAGSGVKGKIFISNLDSLPKKIAINKAEFILSQSATDAQYPAPLVLDLFRIDDAGQPQRLEDEGTSSFDGTRVTEVVNGTAINRFHFNIKKYFQKLVQGVYHNNGFYLQTLSSNSNSERVVIANSSADKNYAVTLVVTYTKL